MLPLEIAVLVFQVVALLAGLAGASLTVWLLLRLASLSGLRQEVAGLESSVASLRSSHNRRSASARSRSTSRDVNAEEPTEPETMNISSQIEAKKASILRAFRTG